MVITYYGASCFKVQSGDLVLVFDPPSKKTNFKPPRFQADIVFVSHNHAAHNGHENLSSKEKDSHAYRQAGSPFLVSGPGEYEIKKVNISGVSAYHDDFQGKKHGLNTIYVLNLENLNLCHLGDFGEKNLRPEVQEALADIDVLFAPINGTVIDVEHAVKIINQIEPKIVIPMHYFTKDGRPDKKLLSSFLKEIGQEKTESVEKFTFRQKDIADKEEEVVVLEPVIS